MTFTITTILTILTWATWHYTIPLKGLTAVYLTNLLPRLSLVKMGLLISATCSIKYLILLGSNYVAVLEFCKSTNWLCWLIKDIVTKAVPKNYKLINKTKEQQCCAFY